ncbi:SLC13 family permease [Cohnella cholangitidis]|uniref:Sodium-dependent dicarboxylate transporter SdcS n=1 Tax=Cohnella cholangitidis TaxID=2598458 RepID=A0A7G5BV86_9BACL|nr:SLC13 family permease [Cohnella cholangitidis]QMV40870.1 cyclic nucleotide-binding domain-containing protein [Cohnella cholangitidis]
MALTGIKMFQGLSNMELARVLGRLDKQNRPAGSLLFRQGDPGDGMFIIQSGKVQLSMETADGSSQPLAVLGEGDILGEMALLTGESRSATALTSTESVLFVMDKEIFEKLIMEQPTISAYFISLLSQRLVQTNDRLQVSNEAKDKWILQELDQYSGEMRDILCACSLLPRMNRKLLFALFKGDSAENLLDHIRKGSEFFTLEPSPAAMPEWTVNAAAKPALLGLWKTIRTDEQLDEWLDQAADSWISDSEWGKAIELYAVNERWEAALNLAAQAPETDDGYRYLDPCPATLLFAKFNVLDRYLRYCAARQREAGFTKVQQALENSPMPFTLDQRVVLYEIGAEICQQLDRKVKALEYLSMAEALASSLSDRTAATGEAEERAYRAAKQKMERHKTNELASKANHLLKNRSWSIVICVLVVAFSLGFFHFSPPFGGLSRQGMDFIGIGIAAVALWIVNLVADYLVALFMAMFWVLGDLATPEIALSGFSSTTWLYMLFILAFGAVITKSGILFRLSLHALKRFPSNYRGQLWGVVAGGALLNPLIPSSSAKVTLGVPIARTLSDSMGFKDRSDGAAGLGLAAMVFYGFTAPFVLTGSYSNVMAFGLVDGVKQPSWFQWFLYALPAFLIFTVLILVFLLLKFRKVSSAKPISQKVLDDQLRLLGKLTKQERVTVLTVVGSILLMIAQPLHGLDNAWVMLLGFAVLVATGTLDSQTLKTGMDWTFLIFIGIAFSFAEAAKQLGIIEALSSFLGEHMSMFLSSPMLFLAAVMGVSFLVTLVVRDDPALILLVIATIPLAEQAGVHPWVLVFVVLLCTDPFFFAYQSPTYLTAYYSAEGKSFHHRQGQWVALGYAAAVIVAVMASVPYWQWLGLIK